MAVRAPTADSGQGLAADFQARCLRQCFEMDAAALAASLALLRAAADGVPPATPRLRVLLALGSRPADPQAWLALGAAALAANDPEAAAAACVAGIDALLGAGCALQRLDEWGAPLAALLAAGASLSGCARAALLLRRGAIALLREGCLAVAPAAFEDGVRLADNGVSLPLLLAHRALEGLVDGLSGQLTRADIRLADAACLARQGGVDGVPRVLVEGARGLVRLLLGQLPGAAAIFAVLARQPHSRSLPAEIQLLLACQRLYAGAAGAQGAELAALSRRVAVRSLPAGQLLLHAYRHLALGAVALRGSEPLRALVHGEESGRAAERAGSGLLQQLAALLHGQALADLQRADEARAWLTAWIPRWQQHGLHRLVAVARLEQAMLEARAGELDRARHACQQARAQQPAGEVLRPLHRSQAWLDELDGRLAVRPGGPPRVVPVNICTQGEFVVEIDGRRLYDRDWKGVRSKALLIALICAGGQKVPAARLADLLWPDSEGAQAMQNLKVALHRLRRLGGAPAGEAVNWVHVKHGLVSLPASLCRVDVHEFVAQAGRATRAAEAGAVMALYPGEFLPALDEFPGVEAYRHHLARLSAHLQRLCLAPGEHGQASGETALT